jgi:hypothetical protein
VCGPRWHLPFVASSGRPVLAFFPLSSCFLFLLRSKPGIVPRLLEQALHPVFLLFFPSSLWAPSPPRTWKPDFILLSIGHIIASETEEDIFRILGTSIHCSCLFCDMRGMRPGGVARFPLGAQAPDAQEWAALAHFVSIRVMLGLTCQWYPLCRCSVGGAA